MIINVAVGTFLYFDLKSHENLNSFLTFKFAVIQMY